ncbi:capsid assembly scaffolding protein Gp46 family protein [Miniphocaeibacter massiliensis]|uniref:capsid assembly scaffolding protein Gp46 family protein n=1 Tax=Miniphocaeibacter massiliensis TaxID=2041841 RepID=UPI000C1C6A81|nr:DUF4355 domain-containing protein [Miniphocaeibacter massiliensis]
MNNFLPMDLQLFAESTEGAAEPEVAKAETTEDVIEGKTFTQDDVNGIVKGRVERATRDLERQVNDLKAKLGIQEGSEEFKENILQESDSELETLRQENLQLKLTNVATKALEEKGFDVDEKILGIVVREDEESTKEAVKTMNSLVESLVNKKIKESARESTPKAGSGTSGGARKFSMSDFASKQRIAK